MTAELIPGPGWPGAPPPEYPPPIADEADRAILDASRRPPPPASSIVWHILETSFPPEIER